MYRIRPIEEKDRQILHAFAEEAFIGITNLPKNNERREKLLQRALSPHPKSYYLFLMEEFTKKTPLGVCGIFPKTENLDYFKLHTEALPGYFPESPSNISYLERVRYNKGPTEICSLYLAPEARNLGIGKLLSFSRFYFMKAFPDLFEEEVFAEMRGVIDENGDAPFWDSLGRHFLSISYKELMHRVDAGEVRVKELMPLKTVYVDLLDSKGQHAIGKTYHNTTPAFKILEEQNFRFLDEIDLFDAGPRVVCKREEIATIKQSKKY
jgi:arginine N-succinyltransferase